MNGHRTINSYMANAYMRGSSPPTVSMFTSLTAVVLESGPMLALNAILTTSYQFNCLDISLNQLEIDINLTDTQKLKNNFN